MTPVNGLLIIFLLLISPCTLIAKNKSAQKSNAIFINKSPNDLLNRSAAKISGLNSVYSS